MKRIILLPAIFLVISSCNSPTTPTVREKVTDNISHVEDSIHYLIDTLPMLCDVLGMKKQFIDIGDAKLYCETEGKGIPLVLINGGPGGTHHYFHPWFSRAKKYCKVIYYDQRGCGQSDFVKGNGYTFRQAIDDLDKLREKLGIDRWMMCGYSYGGALAQYYTATYPEHVMGMILIGAAPLLNDPILNESREYDFISKEENDKIVEIYKMYRDKKISLLQLFYNKDINGDWKRQNFNKPTNEELIRGALYEWINDSGYNGIMSTSYTRYDFRHVFDSCPIPTLICEGKWDLTWKPEKADILKNNHPNSKLVLFENAGHSIYCDEPDMFFKTLKEFAKSLNPVQEEQILAWKEHTKRILMPQEILFENESLFLNMVELEGPEKALEYYAGFRKANKTGQLFSENSMNTLGYSFLSKKDYLTAIRLFEANVESYPGSWNVYDSLGEACLAAGDRTKARENYRKSVELNPQNENGKKILAEMD